MNELKSFPFQAQISYTALDGSKCLRVVTQQQEICHEREVVQKEANYEMLSYNCMQKATTNARAGDLKQAQAIMKGFKRGMQKNTYTEDQKEVYKQIEGQIGSVYSKIGHTVRNVDDEDEQVLMSKKKKAAVRSEPMIMKQKAKAPASKFAGKQNDALS